MEESRTASILVVIYDSTVECRKNETSTILMNEIILIPVPIAPVVAVKSEQSGGLDIEYFEMRYTLMR